MGAYDEYSSDSLEDWEYPDEPDEPDEDDEDDDSITLPCPACGTDVYEDAEQCPVCGEFIVFNNSPWQGRSLVWVILGTLGIVATILALSLAGSLFG